MSKNLSNTIFTFHLNTASRLAARHSPLETESQWHVTGGFGRRHIVLVSSTSYETQQATSHTSQSLTSCPTLSTPRLYDASRPQDCENLPGCFGLELAWSPPLSRPWKSTWRQSAEALASEMSIVLDHMQWDPSVYGSTVRNADTFRRFAVLVDDSSLLLQGLLQEPASSSHF